ncbi:MAG TPA: carboxypeptidase-like regulatory domain-containing protein [Rhizomicrobium sp.]|nr:carboxypeptidase-like regulatory domain-containing protein [Rhizomicrobium sp.]
MGTADDVARDLLAWAGTVLPKIPASARPLGARERGAGIDVRLMGLAPRPSPRATNPPSTIDLDFLVTVQMSDAFDEERALAELLLAVAERSDFEILPGRPAAEICAALGIPVAAGFVLRAPLTRAREIKPAPLVRFPLQVDAAGLGAVEGIVTGPGDVPIAGAVVTLAGGGRETRSDRNGRFRLAGLPRETSGVKLHVRARGVEIDASAMPGTNVVLKLPLEV